jgi:hypothetical protein
VYEIRPRTENRWKAGSGPMGTESANRRLEKYENGGGRKE